MTSAGDLYVGLVLAGAGLAVLGAGLLVRDVRERWCRSWGALSWFERWGGGRG